MFYSSTRIRKHLLVICFTIAKNVLLFTLIPTKRHKSYTDFNYDEIIGFYTKRTRLRLTLKNMYVNMYVSVARFSKIYIIFITTQKVKIENVAQSCYEELVHIFRIKIRVGVATFCWKQNEKFLNIIMVM